MDNLPQENPNLKPIIPLDQVNPLTPITPYASNSDLKPTDGLKQMESVLESVSTQLKSDNSVVADSNTQTEEAMVEDSVQKPTLPPLPIKPTLPPLPIKEENPVVMKVQQENSFKKEVKDNTLIVALGLFGMLIICALTIFFYVTYSNITAQNQAQENLSQTAVVK